MILTSDNISWILFLQLNVSKTFPNLNVVAHSVVPASWGSFVPRVAIFIISRCVTFKMLPVLYCPK